MQSGVPICLQETCSYAIQTLSVGPLTPLSKEIMQEASLRCPLWLYGYAHAWQFSRAAAASWFGARPESHSDRCPTLAFVFRGLCPDAVLLRAITQVAYPTCSTTTHQTPSDTSHSRSQLASHTHSATMDVGSRNDATSESSAPSPLVLVSPMSPMESQQPSEQLVTLTVVWHAEMSAGPSASCSTTLWKSRAQQPPAAETWW